MEIEEYIKLEKVCEQICDHYCQYPKLIDDEDVLINICDKCPLDNFMFDGKREMEDEHERYLE